MPKRKTPPPSLFILGCVRSGTTFIRNLLLKQKKIICPQETHYYRYGEPFKTDSYRNQINQKILKLHRELDGISHEEFMKIYHQSRNRRELMEGYVGFMANQLGLNDFKWFDKTPQNIYGLPLIMADFPRVKFLSMIRNPLNVVASLKLGKVIKVRNIHAACNYWLDAVRILNIHREQLGSRLIEVKYEDLISNPQKTMNDILEFSSIGNEPFLYDSSDMKKEKNQFKYVLNEAEQKIVIRVCGKLASRYGYNLEVSLDEALESQVK